MGLATFGLAAVVVVAILPAPLAWQRFSAALAALVRLVAIATGEATGRPRASAKASHEFGKVPSSRRRPQG